MRAPRISFVGGVYHVTCRTNNGELYFNEEDHIKFILAMVMAKHKYNVDIHGYCLMKNHYHLIIGTPTEPANLSKFMHHLNGNFARDYNRRHKRTGHLWGKRFDSTVIDSDKYMINCLIYLDMNIVVCGRHTHPRNWEFNTYKVYACGTENDLITLPDAYLKLGKTPEERQQRYYDMIEARIKEKGMSQELENALMRGLVMGTPEFVAEIIKENTKSTYYQKHRIHKCEGVCYVRKIRKPLRE